eukprot:TRINITY_DN28885_c0_g1_i1.p1 TRINITY_DN28885_c0_g1~~TRINITY_DN28885_c0_g1_i1.p1  ORF type:complete len:554 (-),score=66.77 TRINITY_DN28885_c0_g1_i1:97-1758(-)
MDGVDYMVLQEHSDVTRDIGVSVQKELQGLTRAVSYGGTGTVEPTVSSIAQPGGFRRAHVLQEGAEAEPSRPGASSSSSKIEGRRYAEKTSFLDQLLRIHGLVEVGEGDDAVSSDMGLDPRLQSALLLPFASSADGIKSKPQLILLIVKAFVASAVLYLPACYRHGGIVATTITLVVLCALSVCCCGFLVESAEKMMASGMIDGVSGRVPSYSEMSGLALGPLGYSAVNSSLAITQLMFCASYFIITGSNLRQAFESLFGCSELLSTRSLMVILVILWTPLTWIRNMKYFAVPNLLATLFLISVLATIVHGAVDQLNGGLETTAAPEWLFAPNTYLLVIGTAAYTFEGIGLVVPIYASTSPELRPAFKSIVAWTLSGICFFYICFAFLVYLAFTDETRTIVLLNLPAGSPTKSAAQILFSISISMTYPLMMYPVTGILEPWVLRPLTQFGQRSCGQTGRRLFRTLLVVFTAFVAGGCAAEFTNFVSVVGSLLCTPLLIVYPTLIHWKCVGGSAPLHYGIVIVGSVIGGLALYVSMATWGSSSGEAATSVCPYS